MSPSLSMLMLANHLFCLCSTNCWPFGLYEKVLQSMFNFMLTSIISIICTICIIWTHCTTYRHLHGHSTIFTGQVPIHLFKFLCPQLTLFTVFSEKSICVGWGNLWDQSYDNAFVHIFIPIQLTNGNQITKGISLWDFFFSYLVSNSYQLLDSICQLVEKRLTTSRPIDANTRQPVRLNDQNTITLITIIVIIGLLLTNYISTNIYPLSIIIIHMYKRSQNDPVVTITKQRPSYLLTRSFTERYFVHFSSSSYGQQS